MADSDGEYVEEAPRGTKRTGDGKAKARKAAAWEALQRSWDGVVETADGSISVSEQVEAQKRLRLLRDTTPLQRGIIRHLMLVLDMSFAMADKDLLPNRYALTLNYAIAFVQEYFEQNPISQMGIVGMRDGIAVRISDMSGNRDEHIDKLREWREQKEPQGNPSLQNALEMCRGALFHAPSHGTREVLIIYGALLSSDPGDIHDTITSLITDRIRVSIVGLSAQVAICAELCSRTNGGDDGKYTVALHEQHFRELFLTTTTPPVTGTAEQNNASLLMMGFPSRKLAPNGQLSMCACHSRPTREGYICPRCEMKVCRLPAECPICRLTLVQSTHLARSYHHLFPLRNWVEVPWAETGRSTACFACLALFPPVPHAKLKGKGKESDVAAEKTKDVKEKTKGVSESGRYACQVCGNHFCIDCDVYCHEVIHNCPGCQSGGGSQLTTTAAEVDGSSSGPHTNGGSGGADAAGGQEIVTH
ncbi:Ssl1-like-domain-containing protein [Apodospora peruviana]|uniref:General transcription and DNA repair factor IIH n=1 Tax=Apodospora peruviana TaxID=516989 RepID=A0AAE0HY39_9PEZI|nr:Ssl1-like-domain-containing protein [Apodospora peruviana]